MSISAKLVGRCLLAAYKCFRRPMAWQLKRMGLRLAGQSRCRLRLEEAVRLVQSMCARLPVRRARDSTSFAKDTRCSGSTRCASTAWPAAHHGIGVEVARDEQGGGSPSAGVWLSAAARSLIGKFVAPTAWGHAHFRTEFSI